MKRKGLVAAALVILFIVSFLPLWTDPYYHKEKVCFWVWAAREYDEFLHGEKE